jgi:hypothetical protein
MEPNQVIFTKGFNHGYLLARYEPGLLASVVKNVSPTGDYLEGFFSGKEEYEIEQTRDPLVELSRLRDHAKERDHDLGRG